MRREQGHGMLHCGSKTPGAKKIHFPIYYMKMKKLPLTWGPIRPLIPGNPGSPFLPCVFNRRANIRQQGKNCYWDFPKISTPKPVNLHYMGVQNISARTEGSTHCLDVQLQWSVWFLPPKYVHQEAEWHMVLTQITSGNYCLLNAAGNSNSFSRFLVNSDLPSLTAWV